MQWETYAERWSELHGGYDPRKAPLVVRGWLRLAYQISRRMPVGPGVITAAGLVLSAGVLPATWLSPPAGAVLVVAAALADTVDGARALITGRTSRLGQVYDSAADRIGEACWLVALMLAGAPAWLAALGAIAWLHEYVRARAEVAGMTGLGVVTVAERPTRVILAVLGLAPGITQAATIATAAWVVLGAIGVVQLHAAVRRELKPDR